MKFKYNQKVRISSGFYAGQTGRVAGVDWLFCQFYWVRLLKESVKLAAWKLESCGKLDKK